MRNVAFHNWSSKWILGTFGVIADIAAANGDCIQHYGQDTPVDGVDKEGKAVTWAVAIREGPLVRTDTNQQTGRP
jgi:hypothetical protein